MFVLQHHLLVDFPAWVYKLGSGSMHICLTLCSAWIITLLPRNLTQLITCSFSLLLLSTGDIVPRAFALRYIPNPFVLLILRQGLTKLLSFSDWVQSCDSRMTGMHHCSWLHYLQLGIFIGTKLYSWIYITSVIALWYIGWLEDLSWRHMICRVQKCPIWPFIEKVFWPLIKILNMSIP